MSSRSITAEREKQRQAVSGGAGCSNPVVFRGQYRVSLRGGRVLDWAVRGHFSSPGPSIGRCDEEIGEGRGKERSQEMLRGRFAWECSPSVRTPSDTSARKAI